MLKHLVIIPIIITITACQYPASPKVLQIDDRPVLQIKNAPKGAVLFVDGIENTSYEISSFESKGLLIEKGGHEILVKDQDGNIVYQEKIFLGPSSRKVITL